MYTPEFRLCQIAHHKAPEFNQIMNVVATVLNHGICQGTGSPVTILVFLFQCIVLITVFETVVATYPSKALSF